jgi:hypothetical protein
MPRNSFKDNVLTQKYEEKAKNLLKAELKRRGLTYAALVERLKAMGLSETERNLADKISRGGSSAAFLLQCLEAADCRTIILPPE